MKVLLLKVGKKRAKVVENIGKMKDMKVEENMVPQGNIKNRIVKVFKNHLIEDLNSF